MNIKKPDGLGGEKVTEPDVYFNRRNFMRAGILAASAAATGLIYRNFSNRSRGGAPGAELATITPTTLPEGVMSAAFRTDEKKTSYQAITHYNNFYEFALDKYSVADLAENFKTRPWTVNVGGLCSKPKAFDIDEILKIAPPEERIYRHRCVEAWSMVIPWIGFPLAKLLERVEPKSAAKYAAFTTVLDRNQMPGQNSGSLNWPYIEGLRIDEAMHPLTILATGLYGKELPGQNGAPLRLVVPWKYGFKGIKSIVNIDLVADEPPTTWNNAASSEYGFYANVNPEVDHPCWSQATERRLEGGEERSTLKFNGYGEQVAHLYTGMDLRKYY